MGNNRKLNRPLVVVERHWHFEACYTAKPLSSSRKRHKNTGFWKLKRGINYFHWTVWWRGRSKAKPNISSFCTCQGGFVGSQPTMLAIVRGDRDVRRWMKREEKSKHNVRPIRSCEPDRLLTNPPATVIRRDVRIRNVSGSSFINFMSQPSGSKQRRGSHGGMAGAHLSASLSEIKPRLCEQAALLHVCTNTVLVGNNTKVIWSETLWTSGLQPESRNLKVAHHVSAHSKSSQWQQRLKIQNDMLKECLTWSTGK